MSHGEGWPTVPPMLLAATVDPADAPGPSDLSEDAGSRRVGYAISLVLHGLLLFFLIRLMIAPQEPRLPVVPVEIVQIAEATVSPPQQAKSAPAAQRRASLVPAKEPPKTVPVQPAIPNPAETKPAEEPLPKDELQTKLESLSKLTRPDTDPRLLNGTGAATGAGRGGRSGPETTYSVKDYIRAQVERRWNLDTQMLGSRDLIIDIHVVLDPEGAVVSADIVDTAALQEDAAYRRLAMAARNAVILSSPFLLPSGQKGNTDVVLDLNPRDTLR